MKSQVPAQSETPDYQLLRKMTGDYESTFYGPHSCEGCGAHNIVRKAYEQGAESWESPILVGNEYTPHHCTHVSVLRRLTGRILTVIDAAFPPTSPQLKAIKDLLKRDISEAISEVRRLEGDSSCETTSSLEIMAARA